MHGEYKVPGGKLVVVDLDEVDGVIANFRLAGDFFLEPDTALEAIDRAVNGLPVDADSMRIAAAIRAALPEEAVLLGFTPEGVATAIRRSIGNARSWRDYDWELVHAKAESPAMHLALDQVLTEEVGAGRRKPTLRFWEWDRSAIVIGSFQSLRNEVDLENAERYGVEVVRRISGGGAMFMEAGTAVTYSLYAPGDLVRGMSFAESYAYLDEWVITALRSLGIDAFYQPLNDITSPKGKIGGAAQKRLGGGAVLHHVTMSYDMDGGKMVQVLRIGREKLSDKGTTSAAKRVDPLRSQTGLSRAEIIDRMKETFTSLYGATAGGITSEEYAAAEELVRSKFSTPEWLARVP
ncbi:biotin/lipoate A/B protein ligase family protein [Naasia sp. SYSU D00057]|uniref:lipoate--protein ligase family protein n=1 Tax=Naasia sp. SYSU D00057 TaxID=2817380 RepID=UPI001B314985|nr:biotin/lipoate A/B protein ligase family protein [Naasia sp. SYSU D00057]